MQDILVYFRFFPSRVKPTTPYPSDKKNPKLRIHFLGCKLTYSNKFYISRMKTSGINTTKNYLFTYDGKLNRSLSNRSIVYYNSENVSKVIKNPFMTNLWYWKYRYITKYCSVEFQSTVTFCSRKNTQI